MIGIVNCQNFHNVQTGQVHPPVISPAPKWPVYAVQDGPEMALSCCVEQTTNTTFIWQKDGDDVESSDHVLVWRDARCWGLTVSVPKLSDTGTYSCVAVNEAGNASHTEYMTVLPNKITEKPVVKSVSPLTGKMYVRFGVNVTISCSFVKNLMCFSGTTFEWWKNGSYINDTYKHRWDNNCEDQQTDTMVQTLTIHNVQEEDLGDYQCYGENIKGNDSRIITLLEYRKNGGTDMVLPYWLIGVIAGSGLLILVIIIFVAVFIYRKRNSNELEWKEPNPEEFDVPDHKVEYDVFVSYSTDDDDWVKEVLFRNLEKQGYAVNIHFKDFVPGMAIAENIMDAVYKSRKTIVVMSKNFLKSMWGQFELQQAHNRAIAKKTDVLILIKYGKCKVPAKLMGKTFLDWTDEDVIPHFWERLYEAIGKPQENDVYNEEKETKEEKQNEEAPPEGNEVAGGPNREIGDYGDVVIDMKKQRGGRNLTKELKKLAAKQRAALKQPEHGKVQVRQKDRKQSTEEDDNNIRQSLEEKKPLLT